MAICVERNLDCNECMIHANGTVVYQIYPSSFQDANGDGIGDLRGITSRLGYLSELGVDYIWLSPFFPSPQADCGYDISDYRDVDPRFGTLDDFKEMAAAARKRGIGIIIDLVMNHTSYQHPWFTESRSSKDSPKREYYTWTKTPNNWESIFGGSAWKKGSDDGAYFLHTFLPEQPDLNWDNPAVREEFIGQNGILAFWARLGVVGFRCDAVWWLSKNTSLADDIELNPDYVKKRGQFPYGKKIHENSQGWENLHTYLNMVADKAEHLGCFMMTESYPRRRHQYDDYLVFYRNGRPGNSWPMMFELVESAWRADRIKKIVDTFQGLLQPGNLASYVLGNHDHKRVATRIGRRKAKGAMTLLLTLPGQSIMYNGEELGMENTKIPADKIRDPIGIRLKDPLISRDPARTPMQWTGGYNAGFSSADSKDLWLPVSNRYKRGMNAEDEAKDPQSMLNHTKRLIALRHHNDALREGTYQPYDTGHADVFGFERVYGKQRVRVLINFSWRRRTIKNGANATVLSSSHKKVNFKKLAPYEARILRISG